MIVTGRIIPSGAGFSGRVHAYDVDFRSEQFLGSALVTPQQARYRIEYAQDRFARAEKHRADLVVRALDESGAVRAESAIIYNAPDVLEGLDLVIRAAEEPAPSGATEYEELLAMIAPITEGVAPVDFTARDWEFLAEECQRRPSSQRTVEKDRLRERLRFLSQGDRWERETTIPRVAFYGWLRRGLPAERERLLATPTRQLEGALRQAIGERIIPDIVHEIGAILDRMPSIRLSLGQLVSGRFVAQLIDAETGRPLPDLTVRIEDPGGEGGEPTTGTAVTDGRGAFALDLLFPREEPAGAGRRLRLVVVDGDRQPSTTEITVPRRQAEAAQVRITLSDGSERRPIADIAAPDLAARLRSQGIETVADILAHPDLAADGDDDALQRVRATAKWTALSGDLPQARQAHLVTHELRSPRDVARISRSEFMRAHHVELGGDAETFALHRAALETVHLLDHQIGGAWLELETTPGDEDDPQIPTGVNETLSTLSSCGCEDCLSAVSPAAYLAHLLDWVLTHVKANGARIAFADLREDLHQPFGDLPASCAAVEDPVRQVRLVVETLWRFTGMESAADLQMPSGFRAAYRHLRSQLYTSILTRLGVDIERLRTATTVIGDGPATELIADQRATVAGILGIDPSHLGQLFFDVSQPVSSPSEAALEERFGYRDTRGDPFATIGRPSLVTWQRERLEAIWQTQDWSLDAYVGPDRLPFIDPALIGADYLRAPLATNPAFALLTQRQDALAAHRQQMADAAPQASGLAGLDALLEAELGVAVNALVTLGAALQSSDDPAAIVDAQGQIGALNLTLGGFTRLIETREALASGTPLGSTPQDVALAWETVFDILSRAHRQGLRTAWVEEEAAAAITLGARLFWLPAAPAVSVNPWQATDAERQAWHAAWQSRTRRPIIDPDQFPQYFIMTVFVAKAASGAGDDDDDAMGLVQFGNGLVLVAPPLTAFEIWEQRRAFVDARMAALRGAREGQPSRLDALIAMMDASTAGIDAAALADLQAREARGEDPTLRLAQLNLSDAAYRYLASLHLRAQAGVNVPVDQLDEAAAILVEAEKRLAFAEWRAREQDLEITLHPTRFKILSPPEQIAGTVASPWLHDAHELDAWVRTLEARQAQLDALEHALATAVSGAEEQVLPLLRNVLIMETVAPGTALATKAAWLQKRLFMDMFMDGCQMTTRTSHAISSLQALVRAVYDQEPFEPLQHLSLDAVEDYESEWPVIGSYATWRAFMLMYLFPENALHVVPHPRETDGFAALKRRVPTRLGPAEACEAAQAYAEYFRDIMSLDVRATCQAMTRVETAGRCGGTVSSMRPLVHVFALAAASSRVYTATFDGYFESKDTLSSWRLVPGVGDVAQIVGAGPHTTAEDRRLVLLFVKVRETSETGLQVLQLDLDTLYWSKPKNLDLPPRARGDFEAVAVQNRPHVVGLAQAGAPVSAVSERLPTILAFRTSEGLIYVRALTPSASDWSGDEWVPLLGSLRARQFSELCALVQRSNHEYVMIVQDGSGVLFYRSFWTDSHVGRDDGVWRSIGAGRFAGAFTWPETPGIYVFYVTADGTHYALLRENEPLIANGFPIGSLIVLNSWIRPIAGVDLTRFPLSFIVSYDRQRSTGYVPDPSDLSDALENPAFIVETVLIKFDGSLLELLTATASNEPILGYVDTERDELRFKQSIGLKIFAEFLDKASNTPFDDAETRDWRVADLIVRQMTDGTALSTAVEKVFHGDSVVFRWRGFQTEAAHIAKASSAPWRFLPSGGDEEGAPGPRKALVLRKANGAFRLKVRRIGDELQTPKLIKITLGGKGPLDLTPIRERDRLKLRRGEIRESYLENADAPASIAVYLKEAYNLVPIHLASALERNGFHDEAVLWYRQVFDYLQTGKDRTIDYSLVLEQDLALDYDLADEFLDDSSNAHAIAATRRNSYTRQILLRIIRCLIDQADILFARDSVTDNDRARELYLLALRLLESPELKPGSSRCADILGQLEVEVVAPGQPPLGQFRAALAESDDPGRLDLAVAQLRAINADTTRSALERSAAMRDVVADTLSRVAPPATQSAVHERRARVVETLENQFLASASGRRLLRGTQERRREAALEQVARVAAAPRAEVTDRALPWLRDARPDDQPERPPSLTLLDPGADRSLVVLRTASDAAPMAALAAAVGSHGGDGFGFAAGLSFSFCIPQNPVIQALRRRAETNLEKLRTCRNIAGLVRDIDPYGAPIGIGSGMVSPDGAPFGGIVVAPPTPYRYATLIARAKELVGIAQQIEAGYQTALESAEREALSVLQAEQAVEMAGMQVTLRDLHVTQSRSELGLAQLQRQGAVQRATTYAGWINAGANQFEKDMLAAYRDAGNWQQVANAARTAGAVAGMAATWVESGLKGIASSGFRTAQIVSAFVEGTASGFAIDAQTRSQVAAFQASLERRKDEWELQRGQAAQDVLIGDRQIELAQGRIAIAGQERAIAAMQQAHAVDVLTYLLNRAFNEETYRWIAGVLEDVYRYFLQEAAGIARLAERQLAFERQQGALKVIQSGYWSAPIGRGAPGAAAELGLTGSARLMADIYRLDQHAFETRQRKHALSMTLDLAEMFPLEFQRFREIGVMVFETPQELIDRQLPGFYLCLVKSVMVSVVALIPPTHGIRATLTSAGRSQTVVAGDTYDTVVISQWPERIALTAPTTQSAVISLEPEDQSLQRPFEGGGFVTQWELSMPKASNRFDYRSIATVLFTVELSALHGFDYRQQVIERLDARTRFDRAFDFRQDFPDAWYDLNNPDLTPSPLRVQFTTRRGDLPPNLSDLAIEHVVLYVVRGDDAVIELTIEHLHFTPDGSAGVVGGGATTVEDRVSTRSGNGTAWLPMIGLAPTGTWELALPDTANVRRHFTDETIENLLLVVSISGRTPAYP